MVADRSRSGACGLAAGSPVEVPAVDIPSYHLGAYAAVQTHRGTMQGDFQFRKKATTKEGRGTTG